MIFEWFGARIGSTRAVDGSYILAEMWRVVLLLLWIAAYVAEKGHNTMMRDADRQVSLGGANVAGHGVRHLVGSGVP